MIPESYERHNLALQRSARGAAAASAIPATAPKQYPPINHAGAIVFNLPPGAFVDDALSSPFWLDGGGTPRFVILVRGDAEESEFDLLKNGSNEATMYVDAGEDVRQAFEPDVNFTDGDILELILYSAGSGGTAATVKMYI